MTDKETLMEMFDRAGIQYEEAVQGNTEFLVMENIYFEFHENGSLKETESYMESYV